MGTEAVGFSLGRVVKPSYKLGVMSRDLLLQQEFKASAVKDGGSRR